MIVLFFVNLGCVSFGRMPELNDWLDVVAAVSAQPIRWCVPLRGVLHGGLGEGVGDCCDAAVAQEVVLFGSLRGAFRGGNTGRSTVRPHFLPR